MSDIERLAELALRKMQAKRPLALEAIGLESLAPPVRRRAFSPLHRAAAVVSSFRPEELRKLVPESREFDALLSDSAPVEGGAPGQWTLLPSARASVLEGMPDAEAMREAIETVSRVATPDDPLLRALDTLCRPGGTAEHLDVASLATVAPLMPSLRHAMPDAPSRDDAERRLEFLRLLQPFERLTGDHFAGREKELLQLSDYVGVLPPGSTYEAVARILLKRKAPLLLYGAGGVGKSTLVAEFILRHARLPEEQRFPFAYLDFDRPALLASEPATILVEAVRQIGLQYPVAHAAAQRLREQWNELLQASTARRGPIRKTSASADARTRTRVLRDFVGFLATLQVIRGPLLLVLDTFEEVQHRSDVYVRELAKFLEELGEAVPRLRVVLSGRGDDAPGIPLASKVHLNEFEGPSAEAFLMRRGVTDRAVAQAIVKQVGGNPLTLHLAAAVALSEGATQKGISDLETHTAFGLIRVKKSHIQGQLFRRILDHIHDPDVVKIAHPGLVLRRITSDVIQKVLAGPCGIDVPTKERAQELFEKLRREVALVSPAGQGVLEHRADVRRLMLDSLRETRPRETREIHELAAAYYAQQPGVIPRAEEIYHRLMLGEPHEEIASLFLDGVEEYLRNAMEELPAPEQAFLASRLGIELPPEAREGATDQIWERNAIRRIEEALEADDPEAALRVLRERNRRTAQTLLRVHEVMALTAAGRLDDAANVATLAIEAYAAEGNLLGVFETQLAAAEIARREGRTDDALARLAAPEDIARSTRDPLQMMRVLVARGLTAETPETQSAIVETAAKIDDDVWRDYPILMRLAASVSLDRDLMARAIRVTGLPRLRSDQIITLQNYLEPPLDEEKIARFVEDPPGNSELFVLGVAAEILRNDTYAEQRREEEEAPGVSVEAEEWQIVREVQNVNLTGQALRSILASLDFSMDALTFETELNEKLLLEVVGALRSGGRLAAFIDVVRKNALESYPEFLRFADRLGIGITIDEPRGDSLTRGFLEHFVEERRTELAHIEARVCRLEEGQNVVATGFLVGADVVLACFEGNVSWARFDSGEKDGRLYSHGTMVRVMSVMRIGNAHLAPLALLKLDRPIAREAVRGNAFQMPRQSFDLRPAAGTPPPDLPLLWLWYERGLRIAVTRQVLRPSWDQIGFPVRPRPAFAGAPVFDLELNLVAIHGGAHRRLKRECVAYPLGAIGEMLPR